jgi:hypothetical protein
MANAMGGECRRTGIKDIELPDNLQSQLSAINEEKDHVHAVTESKVGPDSKRNRSCLAVYRNRQAGISKA